MPTSRVSKKLAWAGVAFFTVKGLAWLALAAAGMNALI